jgi:hypothetical protein
MEALQLEIGCVGCPLQEPFLPMGPLTIHCWLQSYWEVVDKYQLTLEIDYKDTPIPCECDVTITSIAIGEGFCDDEFFSITRCRLACCSVFLSDITKANGRHLDPTRGQPGVDYRHFTDYPFPREQALQQDWAVWERLWSNYCYADGSLPCSLGKWLHPTHQRWEWFYHPDQDVVVQRVVERFWAYRPCLDDGMILTRASNRYVRVGEWTTQSVQGFQPTTIRVDGADVVHLSVGPGLN